ncbi:23S rRNA (pseudouridine(1915)-N(3))-methyltransferase RlmH [Harryflintia acetispora]|nr:23S rRNA (pseudouridine(1915)-N(3))-methyltransferase RlmH [Harryflintia acetispora]
MMNVTVLAVGKLKERYLTDGCREYEKRLGAFCKLNLVELPEHRLPDNPSAAEIQNGIEREGDMILAKIPAGSTTVALCIEGRQLSSEELAAQIEKLGIAGNSSLCFIIGGSWGLSGRVKERCALRLSMSRMTFPHQLARLLLLEQLYRAFSILNHSKYHK